ncbi:Transcriptional regulator, TetR family [Actinokineospora spheciospongiae]|uniref:Transcriptional regulator, TetR family n=1 Tax=Actinokineospora spheciospongiae TaxID=909613 RepID=W7IS53_9PSEU|nr:TetR/AcrR family transcriptional regulator [Actinokineospora spheciospongiae]EWC63750.1 Transcriptional regulator, TetR family [Actinokineospora spheciospongiae]
MTAHTGTKGVPRAEREPQILDAAVAEFGRHGYANASVATVAAVAGISKPLVYSYFGSKEDLFIACLRRGADNVITSIEAARPHTGMRLPAETLRAVFTALGPRPHDWTLIHDLTPPVNSAAAAAARGYRHTLSEMAVDGVRSLLAERGNTDPTDASALVAVWLSTVTALVRWWQDHPAESAQNMTDRCERLITALFAP